MNSHSHDYLYRENIPDFVRSTMNTSEACLPKIWTEMFSFQLSTERDVKSQFSGTVGTNV